MAKTNLYVKLEISKSSGYIIINDFFLTDDLNEVYQDRLKTAKSFSTNEKYEILEGFELMHLLLENVEYDGRKRKITENDIKVTMQKQGYANMIGENWLVSYYNPTDKLLNLLDNQLNKRKQFVAEGKFISLKDISVA